MNVTAKRVWALGLVALMQAGCPDSEPTPDPTPGAQTQTPSASPLVATPSASATEALTATQAHPPTASAPPTASPPPTLTLPPATAAPTLSPAPSPSLTSTPQAPTASATFTATMTASPTPTATPSPLPPSPPPSFAPLTQTPTDAPTPTPTASRAPTATPTPTPTVPTPTPTPWPDRDGDGYTTQTDCDDNNADAWPGAPELCDGVDTDCDGLDDADDDDVSDAATWFDDDDGDGFGTEDQTRAACEQPEGYAADGGDCDDDDGAIHPGADEICDSIDNDCDGLIDDEDDSLTGAATWYADADEDYFGDPDVSQVACEQPEGMVNNDLDCDDSDAAQNPAAVWYEDSDEDGYGSLTVLVLQCERPPGWVSTSGDCDEADPAYNPGAPEDDCTDPNDYNCDGETAFTDTDGDGVGACEDCDDSSSLIGAPEDETCDGVDNDCDTTVDEALLGSGEACPADSCAAVAADQPDATSGDYWIGGSGDASQLACFMELGGGWTRVTETVAAGLDGTSTKEYLYFKNGRWYRSPQTTQPWSWDAGRQLTGVYSYDDGSGPNSYTCNGSGETPQFGVGCSNGPGHTAKTLPYYNKDPASGRCTICQDVPAVFEVGPCETNVEIYYRQAL